MKASSLRLDELDLKILRVLTLDGRATFKTIAEKVGSDEKTTARRVAKLVQSGVILRFVAEVDWSKLGVTCVAHIGTRTSADASLRRSLFEAIEKQPRVVWAYATVGADEYVLLAMDKDIASLRQNVIDPLEPLTAGVSSSIVSKTIKQANYSQLIELVEHQFAR